MPTPDIRVTPCNDSEINPDGEYVLYWMIAHRRLRHTFALERAAERAAALDLPLVIFEPLRVGYRWASDRMHRFILDGMGEHEAALADTTATYYPYVEPEAGAGEGLLAALAARAALVVTDDWPCFFIPRMVAAAASQVDVLVEMVDANGVLPLRAADRVYTTAYSFRRGLHKMLPAHLADTPMAHPLKLLPGRELADDALDDVLARWPRASPELLEQGNTDALAALPIDHSVPAVAETPGGWTAARARLDAFIADALAGYKDGRNDPSDDGASNLSPYLHFGHIGAHEVFAEVMATCGWTPDDVADKATGKREGWWNASEAAESFIDELVTWREIGFNLTHHTDDYDQFDSLPDWAKTTIAEHADDEREHVYTLQQFEDAETHDPLWNAAQTQLVRTGEMHNYLRMLWGKKIIEWTAHPSDALDVMVELNNKYALDGRDPNSYSGIFWCLGRYDRGWTERPIMGKLRYMTSASTRRKYKVDGYIETYS